MTTSIHQATNSGLHSHRAVSHPAVCSFIQTWILDRIIQNKFGNCLVKWQVHLVTNSGRLHPHRAVSHPVQCSSFLHAVWSSKYPKKFGKPFGEVASTSNYKTRVSSTYYNWSLICMFVFPSSCLMKWISKKIWETVWCNGKYFWPEDLGSVPQVYTIGHTDVFVFPLSCLIRWVSENNLGN